MSTPAFKVKRQHQSASGSQASIKQEFVSSKANGHGQFIDEGPIRDATSSLGLKRKREDCQPLDSCSTSGTALSEYKRKKEEIPSKRPPSVIMAIDFGTTRSGVAFFYTETPEIPYIVDHWPDRRSQDIEGQSSKKVPTEISYENGHFKWGLQISPNSPRHSWFKLELDPGQSATLRKLTEIFSDNDDEETDVEVPVEKKVTDFLQYKVSGGILAGIPRVFCLTVPAVWSEKSQHLTLQCAKDAGFADDAEIIIVTEPEVAATYTLDKMNPHQLNVGDSFVLCNCGGGTVDLITYEILKLTPILKIRELVPGSGGVCGSTIINRHFENWLIAKCGDDEAWEKSVLSKAMKSFDTTIKPDYNGDQEEEWSVPLRLDDNRELGIRRGHMAISGKRVQKSFEQVFKDIVELVQGQIQSAAPKVPKAVILVGGFGQSTYLREHLRAELSGTGVDVIQSPNGEIAIVQGALMRARAQLDPSDVRVQVCERAARKFFGITHMVPYNPRLHDSSRREWSEEDKGYFVQVMQWFVKKGDKLTESEPRLFDFYFDSRVRGGGGKPKEVKVELMVAHTTANDEAPLYLERELKHFAEIRADLSKVLARTMMKVTGHDKRRYYRIKYQIAVTFKSGSVNYELYYQGKNYDTLKSTKLQVCLENLQSGEWIGIYSKLKDSGEVESVGNLVGIFDVDITIQIV